MMRVLPSLTVTPAMLLSTTVALEDPSPVWAAATAWAKDDLCHRVETHLVYRRITAGTTATAPELDPANWKAIRPTNKWAMFDHLRSTQTTVSGGPLTVVLQPGQRADSLGLLNLVGSRAKIQVHQGSTLITEREQSLIQHTVQNWYEYFTGDPEQRPSLVVWDLPPFRDAKITVTIEPASGVASCGRLSVGMGVNVGEVEWNPENDALNFSRIERDFDGALTPDVTLIARRSVPKANLRVRIDAANVPRMLRLREQLNAVPALWAGWTRYPNSPYAEAFLLYGIYRRFPIRPSNKLYASADLEIEEM
ncbi:hypothetical protein [Acidovorax sp. Root219]|uniref:hypothetical protein n=1 Tax=Acidovorax sp. Root219 TaxID=1736493 RepID=UPI0007126485|nr:hypothetical protein [Acidovorax sp. Root219]KRC20161.1 hypothetical protein ASE28_28125 [Acidovorax sp. Root219]